ncbi:MAG TPA: glycosyltransferase family 4 protein [Acidimicrobiales bacterium]|nr:glycosyltransferase family 4 protein [Acidimicrobiales bacterium]
MELVHAELIRRLADRYQFTVFATDVDPDVRKLVKWHRIRVPRRPIPLKTALFSLVAGLRLVRAPVDLVHTCGAVVLNRVDASTVHFCHAGYLGKRESLAPSAMPPVRRLNTAIKRVQALAMERWSYRSSHVRVLLAVSSQVESELADHFPGTAVRLTPNGVDLRRFRPDRATRQSVRAEAGATDDDVVVLFVGGDWARKGLDTAVNALAVARRAGAPVRLWVVGSGDQHRYRQLAEEAGVGQSIRFWGHQSDVAPWYQAADIFLCTSTYESFSLALVEAAAAGLPLVTTHVGVAAQLFATGAVGPPGALVEDDPLAVGEALVTLATDSAARERCSRAARRRAEPFDWERLADAVDQVYRDLLADGGRR